jgi:SulP family sulfate permease
MVYANSVLFLRSGGGSFVSEIVLCLTSVILWVKGSEIAGYVPSVLIGALIFHLGMELIKEALYDTWSVGMHPLEYATIVAIVVVMGLLGFTEGIFFGIILSCLFFVVIYARKNVIRESFNGLQLRSTVHRLFRQQLFLDTVGDQIHIIKLQGFMFFGTISQLSAHIDQTCLDYKRTRFVVLDFELLTGVDYSGFESFSRIKRSLFRRKIHLIFCGVGDLMSNMKRSGVLHIDTNVLDSESLLQIFENLNEALEWCENYLLVSFSRRSDNSRTKTSIILSLIIVPISMSIDESTISPTPRLKMLNDAASLVMNG